MPRSPFVMSDEKLRVVSSAEMSTVERWAAKGCAILTEICLSLVPFAYSTSLRLHRSYLSLPWMQRVNQSAYWGPLSRYISWKSILDSRTAAAWTPFRLGGKNRPLVAIIPFLLYLDASKENKAEKCLNGLLYEGSNKTDVSNNNTNLWLKRQESNYCNAVNATKPRRVGLNLNNLEF